MTVRNRAREIIDTRARADLVVDCASHGSNDDPRFETVPDVVIIFAFVAEYSRRRVSNATERRACHGKHVKRHLIS